MSWTSAGVAEKTGIFGWSYNRGNYKFDQELRFARFNAGRKMAMAETGMFREDVLDLATVSIEKMKIYAPLVTMALGYCITIFVEGRSGLKFPGPPTFVSGLYLQCLGMAFAFFTLATWLLFHSALRAQVAATQLRTRVVRLPVPNQRQLDGARRLLSSFEEENVYDEFKIPFVMPHMAQPEGHADADDEEDFKPRKGKMSKAKAGKLAAKTIGKSHNDGPDAKDVVRMPGLKYGAPSWVQNEMRHREGFKNDVAGAKAKEIYKEPLEHFEYMRQVQKEYWGAEAYARVNMLFGYMHLIQCFAYWLVLHNFAELQMVWCANICAAGLSGGVWLMFRLDVLPDYGGKFPIEASGPFVAAIALTLQYTANPEQVIIDISRAVAIFCLILQILWTFRLYAVAVPSNSKMVAKAKESGGGSFNESAACDFPAWLPEAFQHCSFLVAPPKVSGGKEAEKARDRPQGDLESSPDDPMANVDMTPWHYTRTLLIVSVIGWCVLLTGRVVECVMGERMLVTNPGAPPWTRTGYWHGWEHGPQSSKHYAHVTPQRGHFAWQKGWGPQGQQELWASDMFGFHPEADAWWAEEEGPEPLVGAAGIGENVWAQGTIAYGTNERPAHHEGLHEFDRDSGGHRRLQENNIARPLVPAAVQWPQALEPDILLCGPGPKAAGSVAALTFTGLGAIVPADVVVGHRAGSAASFTLKGVFELGLARGATWVNASLMVVTGSGAVATCPTVGHGGGTSHCSPLGLPKLPVDGVSAGGRVPPAAMLHRERPNAPLRAAVAVAGGRRAAILELSDVDGLSWQEVGEAAIPADEAEGVELAAIATAEKQVLLMTSDGVTYQWDVADGQLAPRPVREVPSAGLHRSWRGACTLPGGRIVRLATKPRRLDTDAPLWHPELLI